MTAIEFGSGRLAGIDLTDPITHADTDLSTTWKYIRATQPVVWHPTRSNGGFWVLSSYSDVRSVYTDREHFTSTNGTQLDSLLAGGDPAGGRMLSLSDGPRHAEVRSAIMSCLRPSMIRELGVVIETKTATRVMAAMDREIDLAEDLAKHIPLDTISDLMGIQNVDDREALFAMASVALSSNERDTTAEESLIARNGILALFAEILDRRRNQLGSDLISELIRSQSNDAGLTDEDIIYNCYSLFLGGNEEPRFAIAGMLRAFAEHPSEWARLKNGQVPVRQAMEEVLRWTTPVLHLARTVTSEVVVGGMTLKPGQVVSLWNTSANFDEDVFDEPDRFQLDRANNAHLSFGFGGHYCLGANLARAELTALARVLVESVHSIEIAGPTKPIYSNFVTGLSALPGRLNGQASRRSSTISTEGPHLDGVSATSLDQATARVLCLAPADQDFDWQAWIKTHHADLRLLIADRGAVVLRGFGIDSLTAFNQLSLAVTSSLSDYVNRSTPRTRLGGQIFSATEYSADRRIDLHNECSYSDVFPELILFYCSIPASSGGQTLVADARRVHDAIDPEIRATFEDKGVLYVRNYTQGVDLAWQEVFQTEDRAEVDTFCADHGIDGKWGTGQPELTTKESRPAIIDHPLTGAKVWFNQAHLFHLSALEPSEQRLLANSLGSDNVPRQSYYGDGTPIDEAVLEHIRAVYESEALPVDWQRGDVLLLDNLLFAHGRRPYAGQRSVAVAMS